MSKAIYLVKLGPVTHTEEVRKGDALDLVYKTTSKDEAARLYQSSSVNLRGQQLKAVGEKYTQGIDVTKMLNFSLDTGSEPDVSGQTDLNFFTLFVPINYTLFKDVTLSLKLIPQVESLDKVGRLYVDIDGDKVAFIAPSSKLDLSHINFFDLSGVTRSSVKKLFQDATGRYNISDALVDKVVDVVKTKVQSLKKEVQKRLSKVLRSSEFVRDGFRVLTSVPSITANSPVQQKVVRAIYMFMNDAEKEISVQQLQTFLLAYPDKEVVEWITRVNNNIGMNLEIHVKSRDVVVVGSSHDVATVEHVERPAWVTDEHPLVMRVAGSSYQFTPSQMTQEVVMPTPYH